MGNVATTSIISPLPNEDNISTLLDENNKVEQANFNKIISNNNEFNKLTFLQMLEANNKKIKLDIMETTKTTMDENNKSLLNKFDTKMETMFLEFQTYMMKSTDELVHSLQTNTQPPNNNVARLTQVYDEVTILVTKSNTSHNDSTQALLDTRQNTFSGYTHPFHPPQMIT